MIRATPQMGHFAKRLIIYETDGNASAGSKSPNLFSEYEKLHLHLVALMGNGGFQTLLSRAHALASVEVAGLQLVNVKADGTLEGVQELQKQLDPDEFFGARVVLLAQFLGLLVAFIGEKLTLRLMGEIWPKVPPIHVD